MKILHLATDDKFLDHAFPVFETVFPNANDVIIFAPTKLLKYVKLSPSHIETARSSFFNKKPKLAKKNYQDYDVIVFHSLAPFIYSELQNVPRETPTIWLGWGFDYYNDLLNNIPLFLENTKALSISLSSNGPRQRTSAFVKAVMRTLRMPTRKIKAIERISVFAPVLPSEYDLVAQSRRWAHFPEFSAWNYGTMEDNFIKEFEDQSVNGNAILVGNSATFSGNHIEVLDLLHQLGVQGQQIVAPLSYGSKQYAQKLTEVGVDYFGDNFEPLMDFMPVEEYVATIRKCGYVIMNHVRQQAVGNIVIMLYLGARVFVRHENPVYNFFTDMGVSLSTVQELEANPDLLATPLTSEESDRNRSLVSDHWSRDRAYERTRKLIQKALSTKEAQKPEIMAEAHK
jgi:dTDP-N-acetylfucosamine:lipid II N-acetylfucosaminyltransferase